MACSLVPLEEMLAMRLLIKDKSVGEPVTQQRVDELISSVLLTQKHALVGVVEKGRIIPRDQPFPPEIPSQHIVFEIGAASIQNEKFEGKGERQDDGHPKTQNRPSGQFSRQTKGQTTTYSAGQPGERTKEAGGKGGIAQRAPNALVCSDTQAFIPNQITGPSTGQHSCQRPNHP